jgi:hypothetical protein
VGQERSKQIDIWTEMREIDNWIVSQKGRENEESKNKEKRIVLIKLKILNKKREKF